MKKLENVEIRQQILAAGVRMKNLAEIMEISQSALSHLLQTPLTKRSKERITKAIKQAKNEKGCKHGKKKT